MDHLKILFVIDSLGTGGAERDLAEELPELRRCGVATTVVSLRSREQGVQEELQKQGFDIRVLRASGWIARVIALRRIIRATQPDVVHTVLFHADLAGRLAAAGTAARVVTRLVNTDYDRIRRGDPRVNALTLRMAQWLDGVTARHLTDHVYANSQAVKASAVRDLRLEPGAVTVIEESRDAVRLGVPGAERRRLARARLGLTESCEALVTVGRQDYQKGQCYLLEALGLLAATRPHVVLLIAGRDGDTSPELGALTRRLQLGDRVRFLGHRDDVPEILAAADLFVFPSLYEGLPGALLEAMALAVPIVASDIEPVREVVRDGWDAVLVPRASPRDLSAAIGRLLDDRETAAVMGARARERFEDRFTLQQRIGRVVDFYRQAASPTIASASHEFS